MPHDVRLGRLRVDREQEHDLAARNVLLDEAMVCKVADFGLSRLLDKTTGDAQEDESSYYRSQAGIYPIRSTAVEAMLEAKFTTASDVWSWAIFAIEVYQDGAQPYTGHKNGGLQLKIIEGLRPEQPGEMPTKVFKLLEKCWDKTTSKRPTFYEIVRSMKRLEKANGSDELARTPSTKVAAFNNDYADFG